MASWMDLLIFIYVGPTILLPLAWRSPPELGYSRNHAVVTPTRSSWLVWINISIRYKGIYIYWCSACPIAHEFRIKEFHKSVIRTCFPNMAIHSERRRWSATLIGSRRLKINGGNQGSLDLIWSTALVSFLFWGPEVWCGSIGSEEEARSNN
jgi:hypothetical protein